VSARSKSCAATSKDFIAQA